MEHYHSVEEYVQEYIDFFTLLQQDSGNEVRDTPGERLRNIMQREQATEIFLPAAYLRESCGLTDTEFFLVMLALCCELDEGIGMPFRDNFHGRTPSLQYGLHLLSSMFPVDFSLVAELGMGNGVLGEILDITPRQSAGEGGALEGVLSQPLVLTGTAFYFLLTGELPREEGYELILPQGQEGQFLPIHEEEYGRLCRYLDSGEPLRILLYGNPGSGKRVLLRRACQAENLNAVYVKLPGAGQQTGQDRNRLWRTIRLVCRLLDVVVVLGIEEEIQEEFPDFGERHLVLAAQGAKCIASAEQFTDVQIGLGDVLSHEEKLLALDAWLPSGENCGWHGELLGRYRLNIGELERKLRSVRLQAKLEGISLSSRSIWQQGWSERGGGSRIGRLIGSRYQPGDIVLPDDCRKQLDTVIRLAKGWGDGQGLQLLFHGSSGTGKTMAASILAGELGLPLFKVDLSQIYDKYIGETEKHMDEIFRIAARCHYLLFFDEADTLFAKRTDIQDSHDKYANVSTAYLLQRIEEYDGILILATNLMDHFDDAFVRRIRFVIKFHNLDDKGRAKLWEKALAGNPPVAEDVSFGELAKAAELSPARIQAAAQVAKLLAAGEDSETVGRRHLREALELEAGKDETVVRGDLI